ncbi:MAG: hypothetical protein HQL68_10830, partial [Magnetococcales bacterium]|nr:hypothetical protein [Magnetococcales bacterium]
MTNDQIATDNLENGEYLISDPAILENMRLSRDIHVPGENTILVSQYTTINKELLAKLERRDIDKLHAESIEQKSVYATIEHVNKTFAVIDNVFKSEDGDIDQITQTLKNRENLHTMEKLIRDNLDEVDGLFSENATQKLVALTKHHNSTARHSLIAAFQVMAIGRHMGWSNPKIVKAALALLNHDIGKAQVKLETLNWPGKLNTEQWHEIQLHPLYGGRMLGYLGEEPDLVMLSALLHHEWFAEVEGKGYGGLTLHYDTVKEGLKIDVRQIVDNLNLDDREIIQITCLSDMVSALEESRAYKRGLDSFKVLIIMNSDAKMGHFHPKQYAAWHQIYNIQNPMLLTKDLRMALPREKEKRIFTPLSTTKIKPTMLLTYYELEKLGYLSIFRNIG